MNKTLAFPIVLMMFLSSCYQPPELTGFDKSKWQSNLDECGSEKLEEAENLIAHFADIKGSSQNEMRLLLGKPDRHELYERTQKFFFYQLTCPDSTETVQQLRLRFDALGSLREGLVEIK